MKTPFTVGTVGHFGLSVRSPKKSAKWFQKALGFQKLFEFDGGIAVGNKNVTIALHKGKARPKTLGQMSFHLANLAALKKALAHLKKQKVKV
ncbi:MAG: VOC family protein, partial [Chthoniobacterales bacterium]